MVDFKKQMQRIRIPFMVLWNCQCYFKSKLTLMYSIRHKKKSNNFVAKNMANN